MLVILASIAIGVGNALTAPIQEIPVLIDLYNSDKYIWGMYIIVDDLEGHCKNVTELSLGCAHPWSGDMYMLESKLGYVEEITGFDIFTHEYLHIRCEYYNVKHNWHYDNGPDAIYIPNTDYWNTCGYFVDRG